jgi:alanine racemase
MAAPRVETGPLPAEPQVDPRVNAWLEIDLRALERNLAGIRSRLAPDTQVMAIVKADAYGHGAPAVAKSLLANGVERFGVATVFEAEQLRLSGIAAPILILGPLLPSQLDSALGLDAEVMVSSDAAARELAAAAARRRVQAKAHVKIDTGMGRVGLQPTEAVALLRQWESLGPVTLTGVCTHFAAAEDDATFTGAQLQRFRHVLAEMDWLQPPLRHTANSAGTLRHPEGHYDVVRPGIALYGAVKLPGAPDVPVMRVRARLTLVQDVPAGGSLGYGRTFWVKAPMRVGIVPIGYADGLPRQLSNRHHVLVGGRKCPLVGTISMDQCLVDLTGTGANPGDDVVLLGEQGDESITVHDWASACGTIAYEILCRLGSSRLARVYRSSS